MRIGIVNNFTNKVHENKQNIAFQKRIPYDETIIIIQQANRALHRGESNPNKLKTALRNAVKLLNESELGSKALFELNFTNNKSVYTRNLRSGDIKKQKDTIDTVYALRERSKKVSDYFWSTLIPHIKESKNEKLAEHVLKITERDMSKRSISTIAERVNVLNELGSIKNIEELKSYTGEQKGIHRWQIQDCSNEAIVIEIKANRAIEKLSTSPAI